MHTCILRNSPCFPTRSNVLSTGAADWLRLRTAASVLRRSNAPITLVTFVLTGGHRSHKHSHMGNETGRVAPIRDVSLADCAIRNLNKNEAVMKRRSFLKLSAMACGSVALSSCGSGTSGSSVSRFTPPRLFAVGLPGLGPTGANELGNFIPVAIPDTNSFPGVDSYKIVMKEFQQLMHPDLPGPTTLWGYADATNPVHKYLGGLIVARKDRPVRLEVTNALPDVHPLPVDTSIMGAELQPNRATVHLHGGLVPWTSDGGPFSWFTPSATGPNQGAGPSYLNPGVNPGQALYYYPNSQSARLLWYHDHAMGTTRLNAYAGLATGYLIRDDFEDTLINAGILPTREVPLIIQDKSFCDGTDPDYVWGKAGDLWYPYVYDTQKWDRGGSNLLTLPSESVVPEFFADTVLINGAPSPYLKSNPGATVSAS
jgi:spore coat protein A, manganese oxidase